MNYYLSLSFSFRFLQLTDIDDENGNSDGKSSVEKIITSLIERKVGRERETF